MLNWRKPIINGLFTLKGMNFSENLKFCDNLSRQKPEIIAAYQERKLVNLLKHAKRYVPYYHKILSECGIISGQTVNLDKWHAVPLLTKEIISKEATSLLTTDPISRGKYKNTSGGSTGEPITFWQDQVYWKWNNIFNKIYFNHLLGKEPGEKEINLWGSERDYRRNTLGLKNNAINFLYGRKFINFFYIDDAKLQYAVRMINKIKPVAIWTYVHTIDLLARYIRENKLKIYSPRLIISTAGTLFPEIRSNVENVFRTKVFNQYGSREVGGIACECQEQKGLHCFPWSNYLEIINGEVVVTVLTNKTMPLIRYCIGDTAIPVENPQCSCGRNTLFCKKITGRVNDHFVTRNGEMIAGGYFNKLLYYLPWVKKFQIIQEDYKTIRFKIVRRGHIENEKLKNIERAINKIMGEKCHIIWDFVEHIPVSPSGKYRWTMTMVTKPK